MNLLQYQAEAQNTKSNQFYYNNVSVAVFIDRVQTVIESCKRLDELKKSLFYNKPAANIGPSMYEPNCATLQLSNLHSEGDKAVDLLHGIIGKATEASELLEAMLAALTNSRMLDLTNVIEEIGDGFWYDAIILQALKVEFETAAQINNAKLRRRFPNKFTEADAINRDLDAERKTLEGKEELPVNTDTFYS